MSHHNREVGSVEDVTPDRFLTSLVLVHEAEEVLSLAVALNVGTIWEIGVDNYLVKGALFRTKTTVHVPLSLVVVVVEKVGITSLGKNILIILYNNRCESFLLYSNFTFLSIDFNLCAFSMLCIH